MNNAVINKRNRNVRRNGNNIIKKSAIILAVLMMLICSIFVIKNKSYAAQELSDKTICYKPIFVRQGDSLWSIANENMTEEWGSTDKYVAEIKKLNNMKDSKLIAGSYISIPYYATVK